MDDVLLPLAVGLLATAVLYGGVAALVGLLRVWRLRRRGRSAASQSAA